MLRFNIVLFMLLSIGCSSVSPSYMTKIRDTNIDYALKGKDSVTVIFESGLGDGMEAWAPVFDSVATFTRAFAYSRPGYGWSEHNYVPKDAESIAWTLKKLLDKNKIKGPYILVGHSVGGQYVEMFARMYPEQIKGVVLVDSRHTEFSNNCNTEIGESCEVPWLAKFFLPEHILAEIGAEKRTRAQMRAAPKFPNVELVVLSHGKGNNSPKWEKLWLKRQNDYLRLSDKSHLIISKESGHYIQDDDPQVVIDAIRSIINK